MVSASSKLVLSRVEASTKRCGEGVSFPSSYPFEVGQFLKSRRDEMIVEAGILSHFHRRRDYIVRTGLISMTRTPSRRV